MSVKAMNQTGDTIVEVLLALLVISSVLVAAFVSSNRSLNGTQQSKERDQGVRLIESQAEKLKATASVNETIFSAAPSFCLSDSLSVIPLTGTPSAEPADDTFGNPPYPPECVLNSANKRYDTDPSQSTPYYMSITRDTADAHLFNITARWDGVGVDSRQQAKITYRVY